MNLNDPSRIELNATNNNSIGLNELKIYDNHILPQRHLLDESWFWDFFYFEFFLWAKIGIE